MEIIGIYPNFMLKNVTNWVILNIIFYFYRKVK